MQHYPPWEDLPTDLLRVISKRLTSIQHYLSFRAVCPSWRSAATFHNFDTEFPRVPRLIYVVEERAEARVTKFLDLVTNTCKTTDFPPATDYPYFSCSAWILRQSKHSVNLGLLHYIRRLNIDLPPLNTFPGYQEKSHLPIIRKMVLSTTPADFVIMVIWGDGGQLGFCRPGDKSWTTMQRWDHSFSDIIYQDSNLYAVDSGMRIVECGIHGSNPTKIVQVFAFPQALFLDEITRFRSAGWVVHNYLVKSSSGGLLTASRYMYQDQTYCFRIFKIGLKDGSCVEINNLGRRCLFLGLNSSVSAHFPESSNMDLKLNCIYFTNTIEQSRDPDTGVYRLWDDEGIKILCLRLGFCFPHPTMVVPAL